MERLRRIATGVCACVALTFLLASSAFAATKPSLLLVAHTSKNLAGPFVLGGAGTAFSFIPISVAALEGVTERQSGL